MRSSSLPSTVIASPIFSKRRLRYAVLLSIFFVASPVHCVIKLRRSDVVRLPLFDVVTVKMPLIQSLPHVDLDKLSGAGIHRLQLVVGFGGKSHNSALHFSLNASLNSSLVWPYRLSEKG